MSLQTSLNHAFARLAGVNLLESEHEPSEYRTLNEFFTRKLSDGARSLRSEDGQGVVSPVDGRLDQFGVIRDGELIQAKGKSYTVRRLLDSFELAEVFDRGSFVTLYLSPRDYHRVHAPVTGAVSLVSYIPGRLWPVKPWAVEEIDELFAVNERLVTCLETESFGRVAVVMVGATCVGRMTLCFDDFQTNSRFRRREDMLMDGRFNLEVGDELGCFNLGSTVIVLFEREISFVDGLELGTPVRQGDSLAVVQSQV